MNCSNTNAFRMLVLLVLLVHSGAASAIGLLLPAVQQVREAAAATPLIVDIDSIGEVKSVNTFDGPFPLLGFPRGSVDIEPGSVGIGIGELIPFSLKSLEPVEIGDSFFDIFVEVGPPPSAGKAEIDFVEVAGGGNESAGSFDSFFDIHTQIRLVEISNPLNIKMLSQSGKLRVFGEWHAEGDQLVFNDPIQLDGLVRGSLSPVPLPAAAWLFGTALIGFIGFSRRRNVA